MNVKIPGISGLGECVLCGNSFAINVWLGEMISMVAVDGFSMSLPMHEKCSKTFESLIGKSWEEMQEGPLRREFAISYATTEPAVSQV